MRAGAIGGSSGVRPALRRWTARATFALAALAPLPALAAADPGSEVQDLRYGVVLYEFFQDNYFQALSELMLGEQKQDMPHHAEFAALLRGGISLSYGLDDQARTIFEQLLAQHPRATVRDRAWFFLGKGFYGRGDENAAAELLARGGDALPLALAQERDYLRASLAVRRGDLNVTLPERDSMNPWLPYLLFNVGVAQSSAGNAEQAAATLARLGALPLVEEEHKALRDRAFTAAGYTWLGGGEPERALAEFRKVRLNSPLADKALLGYGWAASSLQNYELALQPWQTLTERSLLLPAVQEAMLAIPYAYEQLGAPAHALEEYENAEQLFVREIARLDAATATLRGAALLSLWLQQDAAEDWVARTQELAVNPQVPYLEHLLALNAIQEVIKDMRDLAVLERYLDAWLDRLAALYTAQSQQHQRRQQLLAQRPDQQFETQLRGLRERRAAVAAQLQAAEHNGDGSALMSADELAIARRLDRVRTRIDTLAQQGGDTAAAEQAYQRYRGLLLWQVQDDYAPRRWQLVKQLRDLDVQLNTVAQAQQRVDGLVARAQRPEQGERIRALVARLEKILVGIRAAQAQGDSVLRERAIGELQQQRGRLETYLERTRLARARLYDKGTTETLR